MNKNVKGLISVLVVGGLGYFIYKNFISKSSKATVIKYLNSTFPDTDHTDFVNKADKGYIDAWAKAIDNGKATFIYNGKTYHTSGGTAVV